jgi:hypothetical protein
MVLAIPRPPGFDRPAPEIVENFFARNQAKTISLPGAFEGS